MGSALVDYFAKRLVLLLVGVVVVGIGVGVVATKACEHYTVDVHVREKPHGR
jgi:uncharacterized membrane protein YczE